MARAGGQDRGLIEIRPGVFQIQFNDHEGVRRRELAGAKEYARALYAQRKQEAWFRRQSPEMAAAKYGRVFYGKEDGAAASGPKAVTFGEIAADALAYCERHADPGTDAERMARMLEWWKDTPATDITPREIETRLASMKVASRRRDDFERPTVSGATFNRYRALLSLTFRIAQKNDRVPQGFNPARAVEPRREELRVRWLSADEETRLRKVMAAEYPAELPILDMALNCGLRWSDQRGLTTESREGDALPLVIGKTKTPLNMGLNVIAADAFERLAADAEDGGPLVRTKSPRHWFERACKLANVVDFHWHDLRHTFATRLLQAGVPAEQVQVLMGHKTITMTLRYAHVVSGFQVDALAKLERVNRQAAAGGAKVVKMARRKATA